MYGFSDVTHTLMGSSKEMFTISLRHKVVSSKDNSILGISDESMEMQHRLSFVSNPG